MTQATRQIAKKPYKCSKCKGIIQQGQLYYKRSEPGKVHNRMIPWSLKWHAKSEDCQALTK